MVQGFPSWRIKLSKLLLMWIAPCLGKCVRHESRIIVVKDELDPCLIESTVT